jgi:hypothetical protein
MSLTGQTILSELSARVVIDEAPHDGECAAVHNDQQAFELD